MERQARALTELLFDKDAALSETLHAGITKVQAYVEGVAEEMH